MTKSFIIQPLTVLFVLLFLTSCSEDPSTEAGTNSAGNESAITHSKKHLNARYVCPMHPKIVKNAAGSCPICGMNLVKKKIVLSADVYPEIKLTPNVIQKLGVRTTKVKKGDLWKFIKTVGYVTYNERRVKTISVGTDGWVENLSMRRAGMKVKKRSAVIRALFS